MDTLKKVAGLLVLFLLSGTAFASEEIQLKVYPFVKTTIFGGRKNIIPRLYRYKDGKKTKKRAKLTLSEYFLDGKEIYQRQKKPFYLKYNFLNASNGTHLFQVRVHDKKGKEYLFTTNFQVSNVIVKVHVSLQEDLPKGRKIYLAGDSPSLSKDPQHWNPHGAMFQKINDLEYETSFLAGLNSKTALELNLGSWAIKGRNAKDNVLHPSVKIKKPGQIIEFKVDNWGRLKGHISRFGVVTGFTNHHQNIILSYTHPDTNSATLSYRYAKEEWKQKTNSREFSHFLIPFKEGKQLTYTLSPFDKTNTMDIPTDKVPFQFLVVGDIRLNKNSPILPLLVKEKNAVFVIDTGDMVFSGLNATDWGSFFQVQKPIIRKFLYQPAVGNHEEESPLYEKVIGRPFWYDFRWGNTLFLSLNDNSPFEPGSPQYTWLTNTLEQNQDVRFKVVSFHIPIYTSRTKGLNIDGIRYLVPVFEKYGINLVLNGDDHGYEATHPLRAGKVDEQNGVVYVICAGGGAPLYDVTKRGFWNRFDRKVFHYVRVTVSDEKMLLEAIDQDGKVFDHFEMK